MWGLNYEYRNTNERRVFQRHCNVKLLLQRGRRATFRFHLRLRLGSSGGLLGGSLGLGMLLLLLVLLASSPRGWSWFCQHCLGLSLFWLLLLNLDFFRPFVSLFVIVPRREF